MFTTEAWVEGRYKALAPSKHPPWHTEKNPLPPLSVLRTSSSFLAGERGSLSPANLPQQPYLLLQHSLPNLHSPWAKHQRGPGEAEPLLKQSPFALFHIAATPGTGRGAKQARDLRLGPFGSGHPPALPAVLPCHAPGSPGCAGRPGLAARGVCCGMGPHLDGGSGRSQLNTRSWEGGWAPGSSQEKNPVTSVVGGSPSCLFRGLNLLTLATRNGA